MNHIRIQNHLIKLIATALLLGLAGMAHANSVVSEECGIQLALDTEVTHTQAKHTLSDDLNLVVDTYSTELPQADDGVVTVNIICNLIDGPIPESKKATDPHTFMEGLKNQLNSYEIVDEYLGEMDEGLYRYSIDAIKNEQAVVVMGFFSFNPELYHRIPKEFHEQSNYSVAMVGLKEYEPGMSKQLKSLFVNIMSNNRLK